MKRNADTIMPCKTVIRLLGVARNPANGFPARLLVLQRRISKCDVWPFVFGHERAIAVGSWQYVVRFKLVTKTTLPDKLSL